MEIIFYNVKGSLPADRQRVATPPGLRSRPLGSGGSGGGRTGSSSRARTAATSPRQPFGKAGEGFSVSATHYSAAFRISDNELS